MKINAYLDSKNIPALDDATLTAIEEFIGGTQLSIAAQLVEQSERHNAWVRENTFTKREQFAGFALIGLAGNVVNYANLGDIKLDAYALADEMLKEGK